VALGRYEQGFYLVDRDLDTASADDVVLAFVHGAMDRSAAFLRAMRRFRGRPQLAYDRRGYGRSIEVGVAGDFGDHVDDLFTLVGARPVMVVGHSAGAVVALAAAAARPDQVVGVAAFEPPTPWVPWWPRGGRPVLDIAPEVAAENFMVDMIGEVHWNDLPPGTRDERRREGPALQADIAQLEAGAVVDVSHIVAPVVVGYGTATASRHVRAAKEVAEGLARSELFVVEGAGHGAHMSHVAEFGDFVQQAITLSGAHPAG
jgi:pimeloyl-ACP methyl ester carboxylesterase